MTALPSEIRALADAVERAIAGSLELDCEIHVRAHGWRLAKLPNDYDGANECEIWTPNGRLLDDWLYPRRGAISPYFHVPPHEAMYTRDLGRAAILIPRHSIWCVGWAEDGFYARVLPPQGDGWLNSKEEQGRGVTDAHALTAAALRARARVASGFEEMEAARG